MDFDLPAGDSRTLQVVITNPDGSLFSLVDADVHWAAKFTKSDEMIQLDEGEGVTVDTELSLVTVDIPKNTIKSVGRWRHEIAIVKGSTSRTVNQGTIKVTETVLPDV